MKKPLNPTLWRTARALSNPSRLKLMRLVANAAGRKGVTELAAEAGLSPSGASIYLRALNARGLIDVVRSGAFVYYGTGSDRSLPAAMAIQSAFRELFAKRHLADNWTADFLAVANAYAHPRREQILQTVCQHQPIRLSELRRHVGFCETALLRHLNILLDAGVLSRSGDSPVYALSQPVNPLAAAFLSALTQSSHGLY